MDIKYSLMYGHRTQRVQAVQHSSRSFVSVYTVGVVTEQKIPTTFSLFVFSSRESRGINKQKQNLPTCPYASSNSWRLKRFIKVFEFNRNSAAHHVSGS